MNMNEFFSQILNMSLTASVVILFVLGARFLLRRAQKIFSYALWAVVLFRLLCPVSVSAPVSLLELLNTPVAEAEGIVSTVTYIRADAGFREAQEPISPVSEVQEAVRPAEQTEPSVDVQEIAAHVWLAGVFLMGAYSLVQYGLLRRRLIGAICLRNNYYIADHIDTPFVMGILRPRIYLPSAIPTKERRFIIAHERHHIRRGDHILKLAAYAALCLHWFNPLVWIAFIQAGKDMEMSCDEAVIRKLGPHIRADYSASLLRLATGRRIIAGAPLAFGEGDTKGRVINMVKWKKPRLWVTVLALVVCVAVLAACAMNPVEDETIPETQAPAAETTVPAETEGTVTEKSIAAVTGKNITTTIGVVTYGDLTLALPEGYSGRESDGDIILSNGAEDIGGITYWNAPEASFTWDDTRQWLQALGLPEAQEDPDVPIAYMGGSTLYGDMEAWFCNELEPEKLNVTHHFLIAGDIVYDVYYDMNHISSGEAEKFLKTMQLGGELVAPQDPSEEDSLAKCRAVLEMVQSGSYSIAAEKINAGTDALNSSSSMTYCRHNEDWLTIHTIPMDGTAAIHAYMYADGVYYSNEGQQGNEDQGVTWSEDEYPDEVRVPWLASFQWDEDTVAYIDTLSEDGEVSVMLRIDEPHPYGENNAEHYFVNFDFDAEGNFIRVHKQVNVFMDNAYTEYESIVSLDEQTVAAEIEKEYQRVIG